MFLYLQLYSDLLTIKTVNISCYRIDLPLRLSDVQIAVLIECCLKVVNMLFISVNWTTCSGESDNAFTCLDTMDWAMLLVMPWETNKFVRAIIICSSVPSAKTPLKRSELKWKKFKPGLIMWVFGQHPRVVNISKPISRAMSLEMLYHWGR